MHVMATRSALPVCFAVLLFLAPPLDLPTLSASAASAPRLIHAATGLPELVGVSLQTAALTPPRAAQRSHPSGMAHVWTNADLAHLSHRSASPDPRLDQILAHLKATEYHWYPPLSDYGGPAWFPSPYRPAWQNAPADWPTLRDRIERGGPYSIDEDLAPAGLPLFGCWYCGPSNGHVLRDRRTAHGVGRGNAPHRFDRSAPHRSRSQE